MLASMTLQPNIKQRDLVRLSLLLCGDAPRAKQQRGSER
jgi:hypothetical protein